MLVSGICVLRSWITGTEVRRSTWMLLIRWATTSLKWSCRITSCTAVYWRTGKSMSQLNVSSPLMQWYILLLLTPASFDAMIHLTVIDSHPCFGKLAGHRFVSQTSNHQHKLKLNGATGSSQPWCWSSQLWSSVEFVVFSLDFAEAETEHGKLLKFSIAKFVGIGFVSWLSSC